MNSEYGLKCFSGCHYVDLIGSKILWELFEYKGCESSC